MAKKAGHGFSPSIPKRPWQGLQACWGQGTGVPQLRVGIQALPLPSAWTETPGWQWRHHQTPGGHALGSGHPVRQTLGKEQGQGHRGHTLCPFQLQRPRGWCQAQAQAPPLHPGTSAAVDRGGPGLRWPLPPKSPTHSGASFPSAAAASPHAAVPPQPPGAAGTCGSSPPRRPQTC